LMKSRRLILSDMAFLLSFSEKNVPFHKFQSVAGEA
jgi:hypothetical protein